MIVIVLVYWSYVNQVRANDKNKDELRKRMKIRETALIVISVFVLAFRIKPELSVNALSVGQGACNVIYGRDIPTIMVDGGSSDVKDVYKYRIRPFLLSNGISEIDYLFVTHPDIDHISGVKELLSDELKEVNVKHQFVSVEGGLEIIMGSKEKTGDGHSLSPRNDEKTGFEKADFVHIISKGDRIENGSITIECLSPENKGVSVPGSEGGNSVLGRGEGTSVQGSGADKISESLNDMSIVLKVVYENDKNHFSMLYTGDISSEVEQALINDSQIKDKLKDIDYLSVPHHGSKYSSSEQFINTVNPKVSVISSGKNNSYGHPHNETLERLESVDTSIYRTDELGQITCSCKRNGPFTVRSVIKQ